LNHKASITMVYGKVKILKPLKRCKVLINQNFSIKSFETTFVWHWKHLILSVRQLNACIYRYACIIRFILVTICKYSICTFACYF